MTGTDRLSAPWQVHRYNVTYLDIKVLSFRFDFFFLFSSSHPVTLPSSPHPQRGPSTRLSHAGARVGAGNGPHRSPSEDLTALGHKRLLPSDLDRLPRLPRAIYWTYPPLHTHRGARQLA